MKPVTFSCQADLPMSAEKIVEQMLDVQRWPEFTGYGPVPGIRSAEVVVSTPEVLGTRFRVVNTDGSSHIEEIVAFQPGRGLSLLMNEFSPEAARVATHFEETWEFEPQPEGTRVTRHFALHARSWLTRPLLLFISIFLRRAVARHFQKMKLAAAE